MFRKFEKAHDKNHFIETGKHNVLHLTATGRCAGFGGNIWKVFGWLFVPPSRYVKFNVKEFHGHPSMRAGVLVIADKEPDDHRHRDGDDHDDHDGHEHKKRTKGKGRGRMKGKKGMKQRERNSSMALKRPHL